jgi:hypothetical protein
VKNDFKNTLCEITVVCGVGSGVAGSRLLLDVEVLVVPHVVRENHDITCTLFFKKILQKRYFCSQKGGSTSQNTFCSVNKTVLKFVV